MDLPGWAWAATVVALLVPLAVDLLIVGRVPHKVSLREAGIWVVVYVALAGLFGLFLLLTVGSRYSGEFFAGYLTEYSLSVDNLFVFVIVMARFSVPPAYQQKVLFIGILLALVLRGGFIAAGAAAVGRFSWLFYVFGLFLVYTAGTLLRGEDDQVDFRENLVLRTVRRLVPTSLTYHGARLTVRLDGRRLVTPMFIVMVAIGTTDLLFALDSIPAIFGLTREPYLVFTANIFALMGLRQMFFLLGGLLERLVYLSQGLAALLGLIGLKLICEALHEDGVSWAPAVPVPVSLGVIAVTLGVTVLASVWRSRRDAGERETSAKATDLVQ